MHILCVASGGMDSIHASFLNFIKMSDGFARNGHRVTALVDRPKSPQFTEDDLRKRYHLSDNFRCITFRRGSSEHFRLVVHSLKYIFTHAVDFCYLRTFAPSFFTALANIPCATEVHGYRADFPAFRWVSAASRLPAFRCLSTIAPQLRDEYTALGVRRDKILVQQDAVDIELFSSAGGGDTPFMGDGPHLVYAGHLYDYKGIPTLIDAARLLPHCTFHLLGGLDQDIRRVQSTLDDSNMKNVVLHGYIQYSSLPNYLRHADVLLHPYSGRHCSSSTTSPMKLGEYMLAKRPIVATDIQGLRNWVNDDHVWYVEADNPLALAEGISKALEEKRLSGQRAEASYNLALSWSFTRRAGNILKFCGM